MIGMLAWHRFFDGEYKNSPWKILLDGNSSPTFSLSRFLDSLDIFRFISYECEPFIHIDERLNAEIPFSFEGSEVEGCALVEPENILHFSPFKLGLQTYTRTA
jgi:hypothetical protein